MAAHRAVSIRANRQTDRHPGRLASPEITSRSTLVVVPALVRNKAGKLVFGLAKENFTLTDDGVPQKLTLEEDTDAEPLALVVVIEAGAANRAAGWHPYTEGPNPDRFRGVSAMVEAMTAGCRIGSRLWASIAVRSLS